MVKVCVHTVVKNEDIWIWYALNSVLDYVEEIFVCVNGSSDKTLEIIKTINSPKIKITEKGQLKPNQLVDLRKEQIKKTKTDWFLVLDGDEIWPEKELIKLLTTAQNSPPQILALFNRTRNCIGDIYHYLPEAAGGYQIAGKKGNLNMRLFRKTQDLNITGEYPLEAYVNNQGPISSQINNIKFADCWYLHTSFLQRSSLDYQKKSGSLGKRKIPEWGINLAKKELPEVLFKKHPTKVAEVLKKRSFGFALQAAFFTPIINFKRKINV